MIAGTGDRLKRQHDERAWLAWHIVALPMSKKFPKLSDLQAPKPRQRQTDEEMMAVMRLWETRLETMQ